VASRAPRLWVIAGPNGAGKSTLVTARIGRHVPIVNADDIARYSAGDNPLTAGRVAIAERRASLSAGASFGIETTLSGVGVLRFIAAAKAGGHRIMLIYIGVAGPGLSRLRVIERVADGGHDVPELHVYRRYAARMSNLPAALDQADRAWVLDSSHKKRRLLLSVSQGRIR
jgi:predicted ABC-type ATPase